MTELRPNRRRNEPPFYLAQVTPNGRTNHTMKQSQRRHFAHSGCDCRDCIPRKGPVREFSYAVVVAILLVGSIAALFVIAEVIVK
jgi:hypothetical protein